MRIREFILLLLLTFSMVAFGQERIEIVALKTNLLYDAAATPNLELEFRLTDKWSLEIGAGFNPFPLDDKVFPKWRHVSAWVAPRYWFCHVFNRGYLSFNASYAHYNVAGGSYPIGWMYPQIKDSRYQGDAVMGGLSYGWHFAISPHFSIELEGGLEAGYSWYSQFECKHCGTKKEDGGRWLLLPKVGVNLSVPLGGDKESFARRCDCELLDEKPEEAPEVQDAQEAQEAAPEVVEEQAIAQEAPAEQPAKEQAEQAIAAHEPEEAQTIAAQEPETAPESKVAPTTPIHIREHFVRDHNDYQPHREAIAFRSQDSNSFLFFDTDIAAFDTAYLENNKTMQRFMDAMGEIMADSTIRISRIHIVGLASFDGRVSYNVKLAGHRAQAMKEHIQSVYALPDDLFELTNGGESWDELVALLTDEQFDGKEEVLRIIETEPDLQRREWLIKILNGGQTYQYMQTELKPIMRSLGWITIYVENTKQHN